MMIKEITVKVDRPFPILELNNDTDKKNTIMKIIAMMVKR